MEELLSTNVYPTIMYLLALFSFLYALCLANKFDSIIEQKKLTEDKIEKLKKINKKILETSFWCVMYSFINLTILLWFLGGDIYWKYPLPIILCFTSGFIAGSLSQKREQKIKKIQNEQKDDSSEQ